MHDVGDLQYLVLEVRAPPSLKKLTTWDFHTPQSLELIGNGVIRKVLSLLLW